jgi:uncharacterized membrane protein
MSPLAALFISGRDWLVPAGGLFVAVLLALLWSYTRNRAGTRISATCFFLKLLGAAALAACLVEPLWTGQRVKPGSNFFVVAADNSQGMQIHDRGNPQSRGESLRELLDAGKASWPAKLDENFQTRRYLFDSRVQPTEHFSELVFDGKASAIGGALKTVAERYRGRPLAGVLLFTDGNATDITGLPDTTGLPPVYPVLVGNDEPIKDIAISRLNVTQTSFEDAPVTVQAEVSATGYSGETIVAQLFQIEREPEIKRKTNTTGKAAAEKKSEPRPEAPMPVPGQETLATELSQRVNLSGDPLAFRFQVKPARSGVSFYRLRVSARSELAQFVNPKLSTEATLANNSRVLAVDRGQGPYRILYFSGRPNWEFKFLNRAVAEDDQVQLAALIRIAKREPKFDFRGRVGETSNPLFRGFGNQSKEEIERYDQPVFRMVNTLDEQELRNGFPKTPEELYAYHAIILDDIEAAAFTPDQMLLVQKFVSERGGGFMMLGGAESFQQGGYHRTPIGDMLPLYLDRGTEPKPDAQYQLSLSREGWLQPWARLRDNEAAEKRRLDEMPPFLTANTLRDAKPGASVVATLSDAAGKAYPAIAIQRFGSGRVGAVAIGDLWHWGLKDESVHNDLDKAWRQMVRWLVADVPKRIELRTEPKRDDPGQGMLLQVRVRDEKFQPLDNAAVTVLVQPVIEGITNRAPIKLLAEAALNEAGLYQALFVPRETGGYLATATVTNSNGAEVGRAEAGWTVDLAAEEFRSLKANRALLETIARQTGGEVISPSGLASFVNNLPNRKAPVMENWTFPLWHTSSMFLFALACFIAEWGLRRWKGMT